jgi:hypothetical protein
MGQIIGAVLAILLISMALEWVLVSRIMDDPVHGKIVSILSAWIVAGGLYAYSGHQPGTGFMLYGIGALIVMPFAIWRGLKLRDVPEEGDVVDVFE